MFNVKHKVLPDGNVVAVPVELKCTRCGEFEKEQKINTIKMPEVEKNGAGYDK